MKVERCFITSQQATLTLFFYDSRDIPQRLYCTDFVISKSNAYQTCFRCNCRFYSFTRDNTMLVCRYNCMGSMSLRGLKNGMMLDIRRYNMAINTAKCKIYRLCSAC